MAAILCSTTPEILFIDMNAFFASVEQQEVPAYRNSPIGVVPMLTDTTCILSASYEARRFGIKTGTSVAEAKTRCPGIQIVVARPKRYVVYHEKLVEVLNHYFATINVLSIDEMACVLSPKQKQEKTFASLVCKIKAQIKKDLGQSMLASIGIGPNVFLAKVAAEVKKPDGFTVFQGDYTSLLFKCSLRDLPGIGPRMEIRLRQHGILTVEELWNASPRKLHQIWGGVVGDRWYYMLRGNLATDYGMQDDAPKKSVSQSHVLPPKFRTVQGSRDIAFRLTSKALRRLRSYAQAAKKMSLAIKYRKAGAYRDKQVWHVEIRLDCYSNSDLTWIPRVDQELKQMPSLADYNPTQVILSFYDLAPHGYQQITLFSAPLRNDENLFQAIDAINAKNGHRVGLACVYNLQQESPYRISFGQPHDRKVG
ncbi:hypothetical protein JNK13_00545 [bacterium]|nr:hypothetical protein [bacterium]